MHSHRLVKGLKILLCVFVAATVLGFVVRSLWNALIPEIFGWHQISFWQALGLLILSKVLFGGFHPRNDGRRHWKNRMKERWEGMTPEQRERFREGMRCGRRPFTPPAEPQI
jgi:Ca2+/H+ antiporter, TMEM165/GDT1 family